MRSGVMRDPVEAGADGGGGEVCTIQPFARAKANRGAD
jgi:hypothetical protein